MGCFSTTIEAPAPPPPTETELEIQKQILEQLKSSPDPTKTDELTADYTNAILEQSIKNLPIQQEYIEESLDLMRRQKAELDSPAAKKRKELELAFYEMQLQGIQDAKELGTITGDLSEQEMNALNTMEANAIATLQETVARDSQDVMSSVVATMVDRGVLQGDIGAKAIADVGERTQELMTQGVRDIESLKMQNIINLGESKKARQLQLKQLVQSGILSGNEANRLWAGTMLGSSAGQQAIGNQFAQSAQQFSAGLGQDLFKTQLAGNMDMWKGFAGMRESQADRALQAAIASGQASASKTAGLYSALGNIGGMGTYGFLSRK